MTQRPTQHGRRFAVLTVAGALALFVGLMVHQNMMEEGVRRRVLVEEGPAAEPKPLVDVAKAIRAMKLVTVEIETTVTTTVQDESWRGNITARVSAPARLSYGTDLSKMEVSSLGFSPLTRSYVVRIPRPTRLATEVWADKEQLDVTTGWLRLRSRAGEYYLGLARKALTERARQLRLTEADAERISTTTKEQVAELVTRLVGKDASASVVFASPPGVIDDGTTSIGSVAPGRAEP